MTRRFRIKTVFGQDDPRCTEEVVTRRIKHSIENPKGGFGTLPDLILADGGITQIKAIKKALKVYELDKIIPVYGMVKDDKHSTRALVNENKKEYEIEEVKYHKEMVLIKFKGIDTIEQANLLRNSYLILYNQFTK